MLEKWKKILSNWINCYFNEGNKKELPITLESLIDIISHLRENLNLDESKSSLLEAHTVHEFITEKYPGFKFENGSYEPVSEKDVHIAASLLLYFVCVNSKDVDLKNAMCKNLSVDDQETILKFSKCLMACSYISWDEVITAIKDACGQDIPRASLEHITVSETPPALRCLHNEVRRLQAAWEAERFDRNYLQEELSRTNLKLEKLCKDKEQYKLEILNLKAKISLCCGENKESNASEPLANNSVKLMRQLEEAEERLVSVQERLDDAQYQQDVYKSKMDETKRECEKLFNLCEEETNRANLLAHELESERHQAQSLRELVSELRQHNRLNGLDSSLLECDDLDMSIHSPPNNISVCSEACANVIEVQLGEERAKIIVLKTQIQELQDQLDELCKKHNDEKQMFVNSTKEKDDEVIKLKQRINEEVGDKNKIQMHLNNEISRFNSDINVLERKLKETNENSQRVIEAKMQEIQTLQEEKMSLMQSLTNETNKLETVIKNLQSDIDNEKASKSKMREDYDNHIMKLNEKVLNRSNELFELQNKIVGNGEEIEQLQLQLKKEKNLKDEMSNKHNNDIMNLNKQKATIESDLKRKSDEMLDLQMELKQHIDRNTDMKKELDYIKNCFTKAKEDFKTLEENKERLLNDIKNRDMKNEKMCKDMESFRNEFTASLNTLQNQLQGEIEYKLELQKCIATMEDTISEKDKEINEAKLKLKEVSDKLQSENLSLQETIKQLKQKEADKDQVMKAIKEQNEKDLTSLRDIISEKITIVQLHESNLEKEIKGKRELQEKLNKVSNETESLKQSVGEKSTRINLLASEINNLTEIINENKKVIGTLEERLNTKTRMYDELQKDFNSETSKMAAKLNELEKALKELKSKANIAAENNALTIQTLNVEKGNLTKLLQLAEEKLISVENEKMLVIHQLNEEGAQKNILQKEYLNKCAMLNSISTQLNNEIVHNNMEIARLSDKVKELESEKTRIETDCKTLEWNFSQTIQKNKEILIKKDFDLQELTSKITDLEKNKSDLEIKLKNENENKMQVIESMQQENIQLQYALEEDNISHEEKMTEKNGLIEKLEKDIQSMINKIDKMKYDFDSDKNKWENLVIKKDEEILNKETHIEDLMTKIKKLTDEIAEKQKLITNLMMQTDSDVEIINQLNIEINELKKVCNDNVHGNKQLKGILATEKAVRDTLESEKQDLVEQNRILLQKTLDGTTTYQVLEAENKSLLNEKAILVQELFEEKSIRKLTIEEKDRIIMDNQKMIEERDDTIKALSQAQECLTQQLIDEGLAKKVLEQEKYNISEVKAELDEKLATEILNRMHLEKQLSKLTTDSDALSDNISKFKAMINSLENEKLKLYNQVESFIIEKEDTQSHIELLKAKGHELSLANDNLLSNKTEMVNNREVLSQNVNELKITLDALKCERDCLMARLKDTNDRYETELNNTQEEMKIVTLELNHLKSDFKSLQEGQKEIESQLRLALQNVLNKVNGNELSDILESIVSVNNESLPCDYIEYVQSIIQALIEQVSRLRNEESTLRQQSGTLESVKTEKEKEIVSLQTEIQELSKSLNASKMMLSQQTEAHNAVVESRLRDVKKLQHENQSLHIELNTVRIQLEEKIHSLKDKLVHNENLTDKLKESYECQIDNLNVMVNKLTNYLKDKTFELDEIRNEKEKLQQNFDENTKVIKSFEDEIRSHKQIHEKLINEFESERLVLKNMVTVTESVMEDQKDNLHKVINVHLKTIDTLHEELAALRKLVDSEKINTLSKLGDKDTAIEALYKAYEDIKQEKGALERKLETERNSACEKISEITTEKKNLCDLLEKSNKDFTCKEEENNEMKIKLDIYEKECIKLNEVLAKRDDSINDLERTLKLKIQALDEVSRQVKLLEDQKVSLESEKDELLKKTKELAVHLETSLAHEGKLANLTTEREDLLMIIDQKLIEISNLESQLQSVQSDNKQLQEAFDNERRTIVNKCSLLQEYQEKAEQELERRHKEIETMRKTVENVSCDRDGAINILTEEKDAIINELNRQLCEERVTKKRYLEQIKELNSDVCDLRRRLDETKHDLDTVNVLRQENEELFKLVGQRETFAVTSEEKSSHKHSDRVEKELRHLHNQVDSLSTDTHSSMESYQTIADLEKIVQDKNRTITTLQSDITYLKSLIAESENKVLDVTKDLEMSRENCHQLSSQLKKIVHQKNEEISDLKKQVSKMSATESRATQIIKLSAKYQAMILKRVAELKSNTILKELTNFGNSASCDSDARRNLTAGTVTMEDLENFLDTTDRHLKRCSEKQIALQKERDRLCEVSRINESEVINMRKFLTELSVSVKTFNSVKELYGQKLSRVVSLQRTVRREILSLDGHITDATMCKLERGYAAVMQDLSECAMTMERWVDRCTSRTISSEKIKQAFASDLDRVSLASTSFQNASLEVQLDEMEHSFQKLLEEVGRARSGEGARDAQAVTVMEVRAEYEDKLNRMKAKMKQLYQEQISIFKEKQKEEVMRLERELEETRGKLEESSRAYEKHIRSLTTELWNVGEKFLMKKDEAEWLRKTQRSGSLMSLQQVHSSGLIAPPEEPGRPSDTHSLRSLPMNTTNNKGSEEGEVFDNRWLQELSHSPREPRLSELRRRNSQCPPHLKSSYPAETQFARALCEDDIKCLGVGRARKEVGITAYKKPGPPTPSKQAGRLSATDSELRESLRVEAEPGAARKTSTPSRLRAFFRNKHDTTEGTPPSRRLSNIFRKKY